jgi:hypothetical protein
MNKERLVGVFVKILMEVLTQDRIKKIINKSLDYTEELITETKTKYDDMVVLPIVNMIRNIINE